MVLNDLVARARHGEAAAIAQLINQSLAAAGIRAEVEWQADHLEIILEGANLPAANVLVPKLKQGFERLAMGRAIAAVDLYARRPGRTLPDWAESFTLPLALDPAPALVPEPEPVPEPELSSAAAPAAGPGLDPTDVSEPGSLPAPAPLPPPKPPSSPPAVYLSDTALVTLVHLAPLLGYLSWAGFGWIGLPLFWTGSFLLPWRIVAPLGLLLFKGQDSPFIKKQAEAALNFQLSLSLYWLGVAALMFVLIGFLLVVPLAVFEIISIIVAAVKASEGKAFRYPLTIRFIR